jgi:hypothetical protein
MPLITPEKGEKTKDFVGRFMGNKTAVKDFPDTKQRAAVAYQTYRDAKKKQRKEARLEEDSTIIPNVYILSQGEARGHDLFIDKTSIEKAYELMSKAPNGVKVKMNHGSGLEAVLGFARNPRIEGDKLMADLHLLKSSPHYGLVKEMASEAPDQFGVSLAFLNESETIAGKDYIRPQRIESADLVSSPASNEKFRDFQSKDVEMLVFAVGTKFRCWEGYKPAKGVGAYESGSCVKAEENLGYNAGGVSIPADMPQAVVESDPILDKKGDKNMDKKYMDELSELKARLEALEAAMKPADEAKDQAEDSAEGTPVADVPSPEDKVKKDESQMAEKLKAVLTEFGIKPISASPVVEAPAKVEPKTFEELVAAHSDYGTSKLKAMNAVMLSNPKEYAEAKSRGITKI